MRCARSSPICWAISHGRVCHQMVFQPDIRKVGSGNPGTTNAAHAGVAAQCAHTAGRCAQGSCSAADRLWIAGGWARASAARSPWRGTMARVRQIQRRQGHRGFAGRQSSPLSPGLAWAAWWWRRWSSFDALCFAGLHFARDFSYFAITCICRWGSGGASLSPGFAAPWALISHRSNIQRLWRENENRLDFHKINQLSKKPQKRKNRRERQWRISI